MYVIMCPSRIRSGTRRARRRARPSHPGQLVVGSDPEQVADRGMPPPTQRRSWEGRWQPRPGSPRVRKPSSSCRRNKTRWPDRRRCHPPAGHDHPGVVPVRHSPPDPIIMQVLSSHPKPAELRTGHVQVRGRNLRNVRSRDLHATQSAMPSRQSIAAQDRPTRAGPAGGGGLPISYPPSPATSRCLGLAAKLVVFVRVDLLRLWYGAGGGR